MAAWRRQPKGSQLSQGDVWGLELSRLYSTMPSHPVQLDFSVKEKGKVFILPTVQCAWVCTICQTDKIAGEMATHSRILAWRIPWTEEPGRLQSTGSQRVGHDSVTSLSFHVHSHLGSCELHHPHLCDLDRNN